MAIHNELGVIGERIAEEFILKKGFRLILRNYRKPYGEIDLIVLKNDDLRFVEVKSVSWETGPAVPYETYRPEENVHPMKVKRLLRVIEAYLVSHEIDADWQFDVICVYIDTGKRIAKVRHLENIILGS